VGLPILLPYFNPNNITTFFLSFQLYCLLTVFGLIQDKGVIDRLGIKFDAQNTEITKLRMKVGYLSETHFDAPSVRSSNPRLKATTSIAINQYSDAGTSRN